ncbi:hypothetical protein I4641_15895 [Waterburya agarophytonicola K14]|uniref:Uncharacterized protein n=1 Tax=Waterburya agarophytonicola KI4 TaxID=2874699 RepID=A0A964BRU2_9CYAN|nr:hypothetical protein [Waterburya agarophytonicola]MCC0178459.1 hypothetical protein [Waterburya agarophytonicola KI4]
MTNINRQEVTEYLADYGVPEFLIDLICEDELGDELVKGWHNAQLECRYKVLSAIERLDLYADDRRIEKFIWDAVTEHPRLFTSHEREYLKANQKFRGEVLAWYESSLSDGSWSSENVKLMQELQKEAAVATVLSDAEISRPIWSEEQYRHNLGITEFQATEMARIARIPTQERSGEDWQYTEAIWQLGCFHAVSTSGF